MENKIYLEKVGSDLQHQVVGDFAELAHMITILMHHDDQFRRIILTAVVAFHDGRFDPNKQKPS